MSHLAKGTQRVTVWTLDADEGDTFEVNRTYQGKASVSQVLQVVIKQVVTDDKYTQVDVSLIVGPGRTWRWSSNEPYPARAILAEGTDPEVVSLLALHAAAVLR